MANYVTNRIELKGSKEDINSLKEKYRTKYECYKKGDLIGYLNNDTNKFDVFGDESTGVPEGFARCIGDDVITFPDFSKIIGYPEVIKKCDKRCYEGSELHLLDKFNQWKYDNWGVTNYGDSEYFIAENIFQFTTSWRPVPKLVEKMSKDFPDVEFIYEYFEESGEDFGILFFKNGIRDTVIPKSGSMEWFELHFKLNPECRKYYDFVDGNYKSKDGQNYIKPLMHQWNS